MSLDKGNDDHSTAKNVNERAIAAGTTPEKIKHSQEPQTGAGLTAGERGERSIDQLHDGYSETQGQEYRQQDPSGVEQQPYDPTHSGVRSAHNQPGTDATAPGRDEGTAWSERTQMGATDTPDRKNPAD